MTGLMISDIQPPLKIELQRFVRLRWGAAAAVILASALYGLFSGWDRQVLLALGIGGAILAYNLVFRVLAPRSTAASHEGRRALLLVWLQLVLDLISLSALTTLAGGVHSPVIGFFVLHMVFSSMLLNPLSAYAVAMIAMALEASALSLAGLWPAVTPDLLIIFGWATTLLLTVFLTNSIMQSIRTRDAGLARTSRYIDAILRTAADGIVTIDEAGRVESANPAAHRMFGYRDREMLGIDINSLLVVETDEGHGAGAGVLHGVRKDGSTFLAEEAHSDTEFDTGRLRISIVRDITSRLETEVELRQLNLELKKHQRHLIRHEKMIAMGQLAAGVAHEISNPLSNMDSLIQLARLQPDRLREDTPDLLSEQVMRITGVVRQLKDFAHPDDAAWSDIPIDQVIENALRFIKLDRRHREVEIECELHPCDPPCLIHAQPQLLEQVLVNVLTNALDAVADVEAPVIKVVAECLDQKQCRVTIRDNGPGISAALLHRVFEPFYTTKPTGHGTGLGLSISYQLVDRHGGSIEIQSEEGAGAEVRIRLPIVTCASQSQEAADGRILDSKKSPGSHP